MEMRSRPTRGLCYGTGFWLIWVTSGLTLGFLYYEGGSLLNRVTHHGNLCCESNLLQSRLTSRLEIIKYEITAY